MNNLRTFTLSAFTCGMPPLCRTVFYDKPNGTSQKTIRKRARYIRSQHQKRK